jgi:hypothetical protein
MGFCRTIRILDAIIRAGNRLLVVYGKHIDGLGQKMALPFYFVSPDIL